MCIIAPKHASELLPHQHTYQHTSEGHSLEVFTRGSPLTPLTPTHTSLFPTAPARGADQNAPECAGRVCHDCACDVSTLCVVIARVTCQHYAHAPRARMRTRARMRICASRVSTRTLRECTACALARPCAFAALPLSSLPPIAHGPIRRIRPSSSGAFAVSSRPAQPVCVCMCMCVRGGGELTVYVSGREAPAACVGMRAMACLAVLSRAPQSLARAKE